MKKILFITNSFERTGSEMLLWNFISKLNPSKFESILFSKQRGALIDALPTHTKHYIAYRNAPDRLHKIFRKILKSLKINPLYYQLKQIQKKEKPEIWYINTIVNPEFHELGKKLGVKVISHIHELPMAYAFIKYNDMSSIIDNSDNIIGCSKAVCDKIKLLGHQNVHLLYGFINESINITQTELKIRQHLNYNDDDFVWAVSGRTTLTKGVDYLIPLIEKLPNNVKILWIGGEEKDGLLYYVQKALNSNFKDRVTFTGALTDNYYDYLNCADAFLLLSREDSFPLVMLEAANLGKPITGFKSGGIEEFVTEEIGALANLTDITELANIMEIIRLNINSYDGNSIKSLASKFTSKNQLPKYEELLEKIL